MLSSTLLSARWTIPFVLALVLLSQSAFGQRWEKVTLPAPYDGGYYLDIYFRPDNPAYGWACDNDSGYVVRTTNGGQTWTGTRVLPAGQFCHLEYIQFLDLNTGYCTGPCGVFKSTNGGASWFQLTLDTASSVWGAWFKDANEGWVAGGWCGHAKFFHTTDGGSTFSVYDDTTITRSNLSDPLWMADMPAGTVYAIGNGALWKTTDDGATWGVVSYTGSTSPWHEELARYGNSFCIPNAGDNCAPIDYTTGGMRFSTDGGNNWSNYETGEDMFGTFLLDESRAWASGWNANVWYTANKGQTWVLRNCGLNGANMDDIFFQNDTTGWVVGNGIYHLAPPKRTVSDSVLYFQNVCPDSSKFDTVWVENINFFESDWELKFVGPEEYLFRVANAVPTPMPACSRVMVLVEYRAQKPGAHTASLVINIKNPDTTLVVALNGYRRAASAVPSDTLVVYNAKVGQTTDRVITWRGLTTPSETIIDITRVSGDTNIRMIGTVPIVVNQAPPTQIVVSAAPRDTGWITAKFRFRLAPCVRDTFITVRVYGFSPILNSKSQVAADLQCAKDFVMELPISNTGNHPLTISSMQIQSTSTPAYTLQGFKSGRPGAPWVLPVGEIDTLQILYVPQTGDDVATLVIVNDDESLVRGDKNPFNVELRGLSSIPSATINPRIMEMGVRCVGSVVDTSFSITNNGKWAVAALSQPNTFRIAGISGSPTNISPNATKQIRFQWTAPGVGDVYDTIKVTISPCDSVQYVVIHANVIEGGIVVAPSPVVDSVAIGGTLTRTVVIKSADPGTVTINSISFAPTDPDLNVSYAGLPVTMAPGDSLVVTLTWTPKSFKRLVGKLEVQSQGKCSSKTTVDVDFKSMSNDVDVTPPLLSYKIACVDGVRRDSVQVISRATINVLLGAPSIVEQNTPFTVVSPLTDITIPPGGKQWVVVQYSSAIDSNSNATLRLELKLSGEIIDVPLDGRFEFTTVNTQIDTFGVDTVGLCDNKISRDIPLFNAGNIDEQADIDASALPNGFSVNTNSIVIPTGSPALITISCDPALMANGFSSGYVRVIGRTCADTVTIFVSGTLTGGKLEMQPDPVDVGTLLINDSTDRQITITNPTTLPRQIVSLAIEPASQHWTVVSNVDGTMVGPGAVILVTVRYKPLALGSHTVRLKLVDAERCQTESSIMLIGRGKNPDVPGTHVLKLFADEYYVQPGPLEVPVHWQSDVTAAVPDTLKFAVEFSKLMYLVDTVLAGTIQDALVTTAISDGRVDYTVARTGPNFGMPGTIAIMKGDAFPAIPDSTVLRFTNTSVVSFEQVDVATDDGLVVVDACGPRNMIALRSPTSIQITPPNPIKDVLNAQIHAAFNEEIVVSMTDAVGNAFGEIGRYSISQGDATVMVNLPEVASGTYVFVFTTNHGGRFTFVQTILH